MKKLPTIEKQCEVCGKTMTLPPYRASQRFCSQSCHGKVNIVHINQIRKRPVSNSGSFKKGQNTGRSNARWTEPLSFVCVHCGGTFERKPWQTQVRGFSGKYCSRQCRNEYRHLHQSGENSPFWVGGTKTYRGRSWIKIRQRVVDAQKGKCAVCHKYVGDSLPVHHKKPYRAFATIDEANQSDNLIGLCQSCHMHHENGARQVPGVPQVFVGFDRPCIECGIIFSARNGKANWCEECRAKTCLRCGRSFRARQRTEVNKFCCQECHYEFNRHKDISI